MATKYFFATQSLQIVLGKGTGNQIFPGKGLLGIPAFGTDMFDVKSQTFLCSVPL
jgi:hypothetical protein